MLEEHKKRWRPIFEPNLNGLTDEVPDLEYLSRAERRSQAYHESKCFTACYDLAAAFDQCEIPKSNRDYFVFDVYSAEGATERFHLARLPMGATWSPFVCQSVLFSLAPLDLIRKNGIAMSMMIDNVRFVAKSQADLDEVMREFEKRARRAGIQLNEDEKGQCRGKYVFLGEEYENGAAPGRIRNSEKLVLKLQKAYERFCSHAIITKRQLVSMLGLLWCMMHAVNIPINRYFRLFKAASALSCGGKWEAPTQLGEKARLELAEVIPLVLRNDYVELQPNKYLKKNKEFQTKETQKQNTGVKNIIRSAGGAWGSWG